METFKTIIALIILISAVICVKEDSDINFKTRPVLDDSSSGNSNGNAEPLKYILTGRNGINDTLYWGTYKPHTYFSMKTRSTQPITAGLIWSTPNVNKQFGRFLHKCQQDLGPYEWVKHDGKHFGIQEISDISGKVNLTTSFIKLPGHKGGDWTARISGKSNSYLSSPIVSLIYYLSDESISSENGSYLRLVNKKSKKGLEGDIELRGNHPEIGEYSLYFSDVSESTHPKGPFLKSQPSPSKWHYYGVGRYDQDNWDIVGTLFDETMRDGLSGPYSEWYQYNNQTQFSQQVPPFLPTLPNKFSEKSNIVGIQRLLRVPFDFEVSFVSHEYHKSLQEKEGELNVSGETPSQEVDVSKIVKEMTGPLFLKIRDNYEREFNNTFFKKFFEVHHKQPYQVRISRKILAKESYGLSMTTLSNVLGGSGYWYGKGLVKNSKGQVSLQPHSVPLYSATPCRPFFPRGFLWDEGFHQLVISSYDVGMTIESLSHWLNLMDENGWIPREQILGREAMTLVPEEFRAQSNIIANPPTLILAVNKLLDIVEAHNNKDDNYISTNEEVELITEFLNEAFPRLVRFYQFYWSTQSSVVEGLFRWRGRVVNHTLASGLDDYPRPSPPSVNEIHVDLSSWVAFYAQSLYKISIQLGGGKDEKKYLDDYNQIVSNIDKLLWDEETHLYQDIVYLGDGKREFFRTHGYVNYFPLILSLIPEDSPKLTQILQTLKNPHGIWSRFGILSLSKFDKHYGTNENYWRGPIWMPVNYLFTHAMHKKYIKSGPYKEDANDIYLTLRKNLIVNILKTHKETGVLWEQYDPETGAGKKNHPFNGWTSLICLIISEHY